MPLVLVTCYDCNGSGLTDNNDGTISCPSCGGYGECWADEEEDAPPEIRVHKEKR
jgi:DnaJ-class molecular chaperone